MLYSLAALQSQNTLIRENGKEPKPTCNVFFFNLLLLYFFRFCGMLLEQIRYGLVHIIVIMPQRVVYLLLRYRPQPLW
jgi:hypothetical protein